MFTTKPRTLSARRSLAALLIAFSFVATPAATARWQTVATNAATASALSEAERDATARVKTETIREVTAALSAPDMQGRGTGQPGGERAAQYIAERFSKLGLKPLGEKDTYFQSVKFNEFQATPETSFKADDDALKMGEEFYAAPPFTGDKDASGRLVFVGFGIQSAQMNHDDFKGLNLQGKIVVLLQGPPKSVNKEAWEKSHVGFQIMRSLVMGGVAGIVVANSATEQEPYAMIADYMTRRQLETVDAPQLPPQLPPFVAVSDTGAEKLFNGSGTTYAQAHAKAERGEFVSQELKHSAKIKIKLSHAKVAGNNVVGYLEGSDAALKSEAVVFSAHYDAFGTDTGGRIFPGAADNALGVAEMISVAESLAASKTRPRRSVIFLALTGEEYGDLGSEYWTKKPTWDIKRVAADFNFDGIGTEIYGPLKKVVGFGAEYSDLGALLASAAAALNDVVMPDPMPEEKAFYRSDHYAFVKRGVPALMLLGAPDLTKEQLVARVHDYEKKAYHLPTDIIQPDWNWEGARGLAQLGLVVVLRVANADAMPAWLPNSRFNRKRGTDEPPPPEP